MKWFMRHGFILKFAPNVILANWHSHFHMPHPKTDFKVHIKQSANYLDHRRINLTLKVDFDPPYFMPASA